VDERAFFLGGDHEPVTCAGFGLRTALGRILILELDLVHPFDRPGQGWYMQLNFQPGF
jgi:hypothetical protein